MRLSELSGKEIVNLYDGARLGVIGNSDLVIDETTGKIVSLIIPKRRAQIFLFGDGSYSEVAWECVKKIGPDIVIVEMENRMQKRYEVHKMS